jgi:hypothetical protein
MNQQMTFAELNRAKSEYWTKQDIAIAADLYKSFIYKKFTSDMTIFGGSGDEDHKDDCSCGGHHFHGYVLTYDEFPLLANRYLADQVIRRIFKVCGLKPFSVRMETSGFKAVNVNIFGLGYKKNTYTATWKFYN